LYLFKSTLKKISLINKDLPVQCRTCFQFQNLNIYLFIYFVEHTAMGTN